MDLIYTEPYDPIMSIKELGYIRNCSIDVDLGTVASGADNEFEIKLGLYENLSLIHIFQNHLKTQNRNQSQ